MVTLEDLRQLMGRELLARAFLLATRRLEEADADTIFALIVKALELDARRRPHLWWAPVDPPGQRWCPVCGLPIVARRRNAVYCSRKCGDVARQRRLRMRKAQIRKGRLVTPPVSKGCHTLEAPALGVKWRPPALRT